MKKRIIAIALLVCMIFLMSSCDMSGDTEGKYTYDGVITYYVDEEIEDEISELTELFNTLFSGTTLALDEEGGTWEIEKHIFWFIAFDIASGSYTLEDGIYYIEGLEFDLDAVGYETETGFDIDLYLSVADEHHKILTLKFVG